MNEIFEDRFISEEGAYRVYVTDEKMNMDQKDIHIRNAVAEDAPLIARVVLEALDIEGAPDVRLVEICRERGTLYSWENTRVAEVAGVPAGCLVSYPGEDYLRLRDATWPRLWDSDGSGYAEPDPECLPGEYYLDSLALLSEFRGSGLGRTLLLDAVELAGTRGFGKVSLLADTGKTGLVAYYEAAGFVKSGLSRLFGHGYWRMVREA